VSDKVKEGKESRPTDGLNRKYHMEFQDSSSVWLNGGLQTNTREWHSYTYQYNDVYPGLRLVGHTTCL
jgi:hypothetical protein